MPKPRVAWFKDLLSKYKRIAIVGPPKSGKTTLSRWFIPDWRVVHTDDYKNSEWSKASEMVAHDVNETRGTVCVEGVAVPRALRKGMLVDVVVLLEQPLQELTKGQTSMGKAVMTVLNEWREKNPDVPVLIAPPVTKEDDEEKEATED